jgi:hypothetical protein
MAQRRRTPDEATAMHLIAPDILAEARGLSPAISGAAVAVGALVWFLGWRLHRFWIALGTTVAAGLAGLSVGQHLGPSLLVAGLLLAVAAGLLAMELARVAAFAAAGAATWLAFRAVTPTGGEPLIAFLVGGLLGVLLFRFWAMVLTSLGGAVLAGYAGLCLAERFGRLDAAAWAERHVIAVNVSVAVATVLGVVTQAMLERWLAGADARRKAKVLSMLSEEEREHLKKLAPPKKPATPAWWAWANRGGKTRKAA